MEWYPTPSYLVKRRVILDYLSKCSGRHFLEVGCGCGDLLTVLERKGYCGLGIDISQNAVNLARGGLAPGRIEVRCCVPEDVDDKFNIVIASEVMEHHEDDGAFLNTLNNLLSPGGHLLLTVPAHMADWGANDDVCGHIRRYERQQLDSVMQLAGFENIEIFSYGVPVYNIMKPLYDRAVTSEGTVDSLIERTTESGGMKLMKNSGLLFKFLFNDVTMFPMYLLQRLFYSTDFGKGYFAAATKKELV